MDFDKNSRRLQRTIHRVDSKSRAFIQSHGVALDGLLFLDWPGFEKSSTSTICPEDRNCKFVGDQIVFRRLWYVCEKFVCLLVETSHEAYPQSCSVRILLVDANGINPECPSFVKPRKDFNESKRLVVTQNLVRPLMMILSVHQGLPRCIRGQ